MNAIIIHLPGLNNLLNSITSNDELPVIDVDYLLFVIIDMYLVNISTHENNALYTIMHSETLSSRLELSTEQFVKLESIVYSLIILVRDKLKELCLFDKSFKYDNKRRTDIVTLKRISFS